MSPGFYPPPRMLTSIPWEGLLRAQVPTFSHYVTQVYRQGREIGCNWAYASGLIYVFPVSVLKTLQVIRCTWWGLAFTSARGKQSKSVTSEKVLAISGFECGGVSIWVLTSPCGRGRVQSLRGRRESMHRFRLPSVQSASSRGRCKVPSSGVQGSWSDISVPIPYLQS